MKLIGYLIEEVSKQNGEEEAWFLLTAYSQMKEEKNDSKADLLIKREAEFKDLEIRGLSIRQN